VQVAEHCNDRRVAARNAQDASLRLHLCCMLREAPRVADGVVLMCGGDKFFNVWVPEMGVDVRCATTRARAHGRGRGWGCGVQCGGEGGGEGGGGCCTHTQQLVRPARGVPCDGRRIRIEEQGLPLASSFHQATRTLVVADGSSAAAAAASATAGVHAQLRGSGAQPGPARPKPSAKPADKLDLYGDSFDLPFWLQSLHAEGKLHNPHRIAPLQLPARLQVFSHVPVVLASPLRLGKVSDVVAKLFVDVPGVGMGVAAPSPVPAPAAPAEGLVAAAAADGPGDAMFDSLYE
jgi:DIS3-like exonuclease 2